MTANEMEALFRLKYDGLYEFVAPDISQEQISRLLTEAQFKIFMSRYNPLADKYKKGFSGSEQRRRDLEQLIRHVYILPIPGQSFDIDIALNSDIIMVTPASGNNYGTSLLTVGDYIDILDTETYYGFDGEIPIKPKIVKFISNNEIKVDLIATESGGSTTGSPILKTPSRDEDVHENGVVLLLPSSFLYAIDEGVKLSVYNPETDSYDDLQSESVVLPVTDDEYSVNISNPYKKPYSRKVWRMEVNKTGDDELNSRTEIIIPESHKIVHYRLRFLSKPAAIACGDTEVNCVLNEALHYDIVNEAVLMASAINKQENYQINLNESNRS